MGHPQLIAAFFLLLLPVTGCDQQESPKGPSSAATTTTQEKKPDPLPQFTPTTRLDSLNPQEREQACLQEVGKLMQARGLKEGTSLKCPAQEGEPNIPEVKVQSADKYCHAEDIWDKTWSCDMTLENLMECYTGEWDCDEDMKTNCQLRLFECIGEEIA